MTILGFLLSMFFALWYISKVVTNWNSPTLFRAYCLVMFGWLAAALGWLAALVK